MAEFGRSRILIIGACVQESLSGIHIKHFYLVVRD